MFVRDRGKIGQTEKYTFSRYWTPKGGRIQNMDRGPWTTPWTWSMDHLMDRGPWTTPWTRSMDPVHGVVHGPRSMFCIRPRPKGAVKVLLKQDSWTQKSDVHTYILMNKLAHYESINSSGAHPALPWQPRGICSRCQSRGWGISKFYCGPGAGY